MGRKNSSVGIIVDEPVNTVLVDVLVEVETEVEKARRL